MSVERNLPLVRERRQALLDGDAASIAKQKAAGKLTARERIARLLDEAGVGGCDRLRNGRGQPGVCLCPGFYR